jgi:hypothetical protein
MPSILVLNMLNLTFQSSAQDSLYLASRTSLSQGKSFLNGGFAAITIQGVISSQCG